MLSCYVVTQLLSAAQERPLTLKERLNLRLHLATCSGCRHFKQHMRVLRLTARQFARGGRAKEGNGE